jgi:tRNA U34 5-methylaminomethyl-2-thiouridine-forming methyltransferase MnmC
LGLIINYTGVEAFPITDDEREQLNYVSQLNAEKYQEIFDSIHAINWNIKTDLSKNFKLEKKLVKFQDINESGKYDLIYFDAFGPRVQPELWTESIFRKMYHSLKEDGVLVTYSAKGSVRRAMQTVGFKVEKLPGPPGKREMLRGIV